MTTKYTADMDPLDEVRAIKKEIYQKFKTVDAYDEYLKNKYPNGANPEKFVRPEDIVLEQPEPLFDKEEEPYTPPVYYSDMDPLEEIRAIRKEMSHKYLEEKRLAAAATAKPKRVRKQGTKSARQLQTSPTK